MGTYGMTQRLPGVQTARTATPRNVLLKAESAILLPAGKIIDGSKARDPGNTGDVQYLRAGMLMGKITSGGKYAPSIIGTITEAMDGSETDVTVAAGTATEIIRRIGSSGTFKLTGPPTAGGTVRTSTITFSAVAAGAVTITAAGTAEVQTLTLAAGTDGGNFQVQYGGVAIAAQAWNVSAANLQTALRALHADLAAVTVGLAGEVYTVTWPATGATSGPHDLLEIINDSTSDGGVWEGGIVVARTATGVNGEFVSGSFIQPTDGSETPLSVLLGDDGYPLKMTDQDETSVDVAYSHVCVGGIIDSSQIVNWPSDTGLIAWIKSQLNGGTQSAPAKGPFIFDDGY